MFSSDSSIEIIEDADDEDNGFYPVHKAVLQGDCCKIISLFEEGHDINAVDNDLETPIVVAINHKQYNVLKLLLSYNDDAHLSVTAADVASYAVNPLLLAVSHGDEEAVQILLDYNLHETYQDYPVNFWTPLHEACHKGLTSILEKLVRKNCNLDARNEEGATALYIACQYDEKDCLQLLLGHGADAEITVDTGDTPLHIACQEGHVDCVAVLLNHGVDIDCCSSTHRTPLAAACLHDEYNCAELLIENHASLCTNCLDDDCSPIHIAARHTGALCLSLLIENGADVNSVCKGYTPLYEAVHADNLRGCKMLLSNGADPNCVCEINLLRQTPLMIAARDDNVDIIKDLVLHGADVNLKTFTSPLILAARFNSCESLKELLSSVADINYMDEGGNTLLSTLCTTILLNYSADSFEKLLQCCRNLLISGGNITPLIKVSATSPIMEDTLLHMCPKLIRLLLEFASCDEHINFLSKLCGTFSDEEEWKPLFDFSCQPRRLAHLCRVKIRCVLGEQRLDKIEELPLPYPIKDYLRHSEAMIFE